MMATFAQDHAPDVHSVAVHLAILVKAGRWLSGSGSHSEIPREPTRLPLQSLTTPGSAELWGGSKRGNARKLPFNKLEQQEGK